MVADLTRQLIEQLNNFSKILPLPWFTFLGSIIEEIIAPIPSPLVMTLAGSLTSSAKEAPVYLLFLALTGAVGKTLASYVLYYLADKFEDVVLVRFGKYLGVSHREIEQIGNHLNKGWKDDIAIFLLRAIPVVPSAPVSVVSGLIKLNTRTFLVSTFLGTLVRNSIYLIIGYAGLSSTESIINTIEEYKFVGYLLLAVPIALVVGYYIFQKKRDYLVAKILKPNTNHDKTNPDSEEASSTN